MTTGNFLSQLDALIKKLESLVQSLHGSSFHPSKDQYQTLGDLSLRLTTAATNLPIQIQALRNRRTESSSKEGKKFIVQAESDRRDLITTTQLKNRGTFAKNITLFFEGQRDSVVDSTATKARKQVTRERCKRICSLSPDGLISWAVAFMATTWTANLMSKDTFDYVVEHIEPDDPQVWPPDVYHILRGLVAEEPLRGSGRYHEFLKAAQDDIEKAPSTNQARKRRRSTSSNETSVVLPNDQVAVYNKAELSAKASIPELEKSGSQVYEHHDVDQQERTGKSIPNTLRLERTGISTVSTLLNNDSNTPAAALATTQDSLQGSEDSRTETVSSVTGRQSLDKAVACDTQTELYLDSVPVPQQSDATSGGVGTTLLRGIQLEKYTIHQIVIDRSTSILGGIWFGSPPGFQPFVSLRLSRALGDIIKLSGQEVLVPEPALDASRTFTGVYSIKLECFRQLIQRDGFGTIFWNEYGEEAFVTMQVIDEELIADFIQVSQAAIGVLPTLDTALTSNSA